MKLLVFIIFEFKMFIRDCRSVDYSPWKQRDLVTPLGRCGMYSL